MVKLSCCLSPCMGSEGGDMLRDSDVEDGNARALWIIRVRDDVGLTLTLTLTLTLPLPLP